MLGDLVSLVIGVVLLFAAFTVKSFHQTPLGSRQLGPPVPTWLGRSFLLAAALFFLLCAIWSLTRNHCSGNRETGLRSGFHLLHLCTTTVAMMLIAPGIRGADNRRLNDE